MATINPILETIDKTAHIAQSNSIPSGLISADSHVTEPPHCYADYIDPAFRERAPRMITDPQRGSCFILDGMKSVVAMTVVSGAGLAPEDMKQDGRLFENLHRGGWDAKARLKDQDRDGIVAEVLYPSVGMVLCNHPEPDYKQACMWAYNRWLHDEFCSVAPDRLIGLGQTAVRSVDEAVDDFRKFKDMGFKGVMLPGDPATPVDYDDPSFDPLWKTAVELNLPISFHIATARADAASRGAIAQGTGDDRANRGHMFNRTHQLLKSIQDLIGLFIWGRVFERHPDLKLVCVEADAGWAPHYAYRMEHVYKRHRFWAKVPEMKKLPSDYFRDNVYLTFQDDWTAFRQTDMINPRRLLWANDFPHNDSTWPWSRDLLAGHTAKLSEDEKRWILRDNTAELYGISPAAAAA
jgi:predicted TIM-barrel fold metal-dependent hydrolase